MSEVTIGKVMQAYAQDAVDLARKAFQIELDFSLDSIERVEHVLGILEKDVPKRGLRKLLRLGPSPKKIGKMAQMFGGYVGEVIRRHWGGEWTTQTAIHPEPVITLSVCGSDIYPPSRVYKRLTIGAEENVWDYFRLLRRDWEAAQEREILGRSQDGDKS